MSDALVLKDATVQHDEASNKIVITLTGSGHDVRLDRVEIGLLIRYLTQAHGVMQ